MSYIDYIVRWRNVMITLDQTTGCKIIESTFISAIVGVFNLGFSVSYRRATTIIRLIADDRWQMAFLE